MGRRVRRVSRAEGEWKGGCVVRSSQKIRNKCRGESCNDEMGDD